MKAWDKQVEASNDTALEQAAETWEMMNEQAKAGKPEAKEMLELVNQLRVKIKEYRMWNRPNYKLLLTLV